MYFRSRDIPRNRCGLVPDPANEGLTVQWAQLDRRRAVWRTIIDAKDIDGPNNTEGRVGSGWYEGHGPCHRGAAGGRACGGVSHRAASRRGRPVKLKSRRRVGPKMLGFLVSPAKSGESPRNAGLSPGLEIAGFARMRGLAWEDSKSGNDGVDMNSLMRV